MNSNEFLAIEYQYMPLVSKDAFILRKVGCEVITLDTMWPGAK